MIISQYCTFARSLLITEAHKHKSSVVPPGTTGPLSGKPSHWNAALIHGIFQLRHVPFLPLPHHSVKETPAGMHSCSACPNRAPRPWACLSFQFPGLVPPWTRISPLSARGSGRVRLAEAPRWGTRSLFCSRLSTTLWSTHAAAPVPPQLGLWANEPWTRPVLPQWPNSPRICWKYLPRSAMFATMAFCQARTWAQPSLGSYNPPDPLWDPTLLASSSPSTARRAGKASSRFWRGQNNWEGGKKI